MKKSVFGNGWRSDNIPLDDLLLDPKNPRLNLEGETSQPKIRQALLENEEVFDLALQIVERDGLLAGERIIATYESGKLYVLEGNRRTAAVQILVNSRLLDREQKARLPQVSDDLKQRLQSIPIDIAPDRISAEPTLTKRHTENGVKAWSTLANMRRVFRYKSEGRTVDEVATVLGLSKQRTKQLLRAFNMFELAKSGSDWTAEEVRQLKNGALETSGFTRFFTLSGVKNHLKLRFDADETPKSDLQPGEFSKQLHTVAQGFLIRDPASGKTMYDTRTSPENILPKFKKTAKPGSRAAVAKTPKASIFFEKLECLADDEALIHLTDELRQVNYKLLPIAASVLLRATFEAALRFQIKKKKKWKEILALHGGRDPDLSNLVSFCAQAKNDVFLERRVADVLGGQPVRDAKNYLDQVSHGRWKTADSNTLKTIGNNLRSTIYAIAADEL